MDCSPWKREGSGKTLPVCVNTSGGSEEDRARLSSVVSSDRTRGWGTQTEIQEIVFKHQEKLFFFFFFKLLTVTEYWHRVPREVMESLSLEMFNTQLCTQL